MRRDLDTHTHLGWRRCEPNTGATHRGSDTFRCRHRYVVSNTRPGWDAGWCSARSDGNPNGSARCRYAGEYTHPDSI